MKNRIADLLGLDVPVEEETKVTTEGSDDCNDEKCKACERKEECFEDARESLEMSRQRGTTVKVVLDGQEIEAGSAIMYLENFTINGELQPEARKSLSITGAWNPHSLMDAAKHLEKNIHNNLQDMLMGRIFGE